MKKTYEAPLFEEIALLSNMIMQDVSLDYTEYGEDNDLLHYVDDLLKNV